MVDLTALLADLAAESEQLDALVAPLPPEAWARPTPAPGWTVAHQIAHLAWTDHVAHLAATDTAAFFASVTGAPDPSRLVDDGAEAFLASADALLARWRAGRAALAAAARGRAGRGETALVRHPDVARLDGDRPAHGDLGRTARTWPTRGRPAYADGPAAARRAPGLPYHRHGFRGARPRRRRRRRSGSSWWRLTGTPGPFGPDRRGRTGSPARHSTFCLLVTQRRHRGADLALGRHGPGPVRRRMAGRGAGVRRPARRGSGGAGSGVAR
ncbi:TIGR03084 family protein [Nonomuraea sp. TT08I-71]|nr:TIGR03084 family protein [Nonomuraea sp. TT08I-71]